MLTNMSHWVQDGEKQHFWLIWGRSHLWRFWAKISLSWELPLQSPSGCSEKKSHRSEKICSQTCLNGSRMVKNSIFESFGRGQFLTILSQNFPKLGKTASLTGPHWRVRIKSRLIGLIWSETCLDGSRMVKDTILGSFWAPQIFSPLDHFLGTPLGPPFSHDPPQKIAKVKISISRLQKRIAYAVSYQWP